MYQTAIRSIGRPKGNAAVSGAAAETTASDHTMGAFFGTDGVGLLLRRIIAVEITAPFPKVAGHIIQSEFVRLFGGNAVRL